MQSTSLTDAGHVIWNFVFAVGLSGVITGSPKLMFEQEITM